MPRYTINSECGVMRDCEAVDIDAAKEEYERKFHFDFDGAENGEYPALILPPRRRPWAARPLTSAPGRVDV